MFFYNDTSKDFTMKWLKADSVQRNQMVDLNKLYEWLKNKSKNEVRDFLGEPDRVNNNGDYEYFLGPINAKGYIYEKTCRISFDQGDSVVRIEVNLS